MGWVRGEYHWQQLVINGFPASFWAGCISLYVMECRKPGHSCETVVEQILLSELLLLRSREDTYQSRVNWVTRVSEWIKID